MTHLSDEALALHLLGEDDSGEHLRICQECRDRLDAAAEALLGTLEAVPTATLQLAPEQRFWPFCERLQNLWQLSNSAVKAVLARAADASNWLDFQAGSRLFHLEGGPALSGKDVGLVEIAAGGSFAAHSHNGREEVLVLQGGFVDSATGQTLRAGDVSVHTTGEKHSLTALPGEPCVYAVVNEGVDFL